MYTNRKWKSPRVSEHSMGAVERLRYRNPNLTSVPRRDRHRERMGVRAPEKGEDRD